LNRRQFSATRAAEPAIRATHSGGVHRRAAFLERQSFSCELSKACPWVSSTLHCGACHWIRCSKSLESRRRS